MKGLVKKLLIPLSVAGTLTTPFFNSAYAQDKNNNQEAQEEFKQRTYFGGGIGMYNGADKAFQEIYGTVPRIRGNVSFNNSKHFTIEGALAYGQKNGNPFIYDPDNIIENASAKITMLQGELAGFYVFPGKSVNFRIGGGVSYINMKEELSISGGGETASASGSFGGVGPLVVLGLDIALDDDKKKVLYIETSGRSVNITNDFGQELDIGGGVLEAGIMFSTD